MTNDAAVRRARARVIAAVVGAAALAGCTYLISFDTPDVEEDAASDAEAPDVASDANDDDAGEPDAGEPDATPDAQPDAWLESDACAGQVDGQYCGNNQLIDYPGSKDDLVLCKDGAIAKVRFCEDGTGCVRMPNPNPDECDECVDKVDGFYCGRDMEGWSERNANVRVQCQARGTAAATRCANCASSGNKATCL